MIAYYPFIIFFLIVFILGIFGALGALHKKYDLKDNTYSWVEYNSIFHKPVVVAFIHAAAVTTIVFLAYMLNNRIEMFLLSALVGVMLFIGIVCSPRAGRCFIKRVGLYD